MGSKIKNILHDVGRFYNDINIVPKIKAKRDRSRLTNRDFSLLASNCIGGIIYNHYGCRFLSPTINLRIPSNDFIKFILNIKEFLAQDDFEFVDGGYYRCPSAILHNEIFINFTHYNTGEEAILKWSERKKRINWDNLFVILNDCDGVTEDDMRRLSGINCKGIVIFTSKQYKDIPYAFYIDKYNGEPNIGNILKKNWLTGIREYEKYFDFTAWLNEPDMNVEKFRVK